MIRPIKRLCVLVKQTPYETYMRLKSQGKAPLALRWQRLRSRYKAHRECVNMLMEILNKSGVEYNTVGREEFDRQHLSDVDLVIAVGGDGTVLSASHFLDDKIPLLGINSDPSRPEELKVIKKSDERRSYGALCGCTAADMNQFLPLILNNELIPTKRNRLLAVVKSTFTETKLPLALNDVLVAHPSPAAVSRFKLTINQPRASKNHLIKNNEEEKKDYLMIDDPLVSQENFYDDDGNNGNILSYLARPTSFFDRDDEKEAFSFNVWSSGMWISTSTGSSAAMRAAGGKVIDPREPGMQYMIREHLVGEHHEELIQESHRILDEEYSMHLRWSSQDGYVFIDGSHVTHPIQLGDEVRIGSDGQSLMLFDRFSLTKDTKL